jgi:hypothetical protein
MLFFARFFGRIGCIDAAFDGHDAAKCVVNVVMKQHLF